MFLIELKYYLLSISFEKIGKKKNNPEKTIFLTWVTNKAWGSRYPCSSWGTWASRTSRRQSACSGGSPEWLECHDQKDPETGSQGWPGHPIRTGTPNLSAGKNSEISAVKNKFDLSEYGAFLITLNTRAGLGNVRPADHQP